MTMLNSYPMDITPLAHVTRRKGKNGSKYLSFRALTETGGKTKERTVRVFGPNVDDMAGLLRKDVKVSGRVSYDSFTGEDGRRSQTMRLVSIAA